MYPEKVLIAALVLVLMRFQNGTCSGNSEVADVKVFNELNQGIQNLIFKGAQETPVSFHSIQPKGSRQLEIPGNIKWNITLITRIKVENRTSYFIGEYNFSSDTKYDLIIYNRSGLPTYFAVEVGNVQRNHATESKQDKLKVEEALLTVQSELTKESVSVLGISENCYKCDLQNLTIPPHDAPMVIPHGESAFATIDTRWKFKLEIRTDNKTKWSYTKHFGEYGHYRVLVKGFDTSGNLECFLITDKEPHNKYIPIAVMFSGIVGLIIIYNLIKHVAWKRYKQRREVDLTVDYSQPRDYMSHSLESHFDTGRQSPVVRRQEKKKSRLRSLDTFRGISITIMIFVNYQGGRYWFFNHSRWNGRFWASIVNEIMP